jgi:hypothetical protein
MIGLSSLWAFLPCYRRAAKWLQRKSAFAYQDTKTGRE